MQLSENLKEKYAGQYAAESVEWRNLGAKYKALNIIELSKNIQFKNVLEVGAGEGSILSWLSHWKFCDDLNCVEISESGIEMIRSKRIPNLRDILLFDGYTLPYEDDHFDLIICSHVMEHVEHERLLLREIKRVSKHQIFEVPIDFSFYVDKKLKHFLGYGHINIYTPALFRFLLLSENFEIKSDRHHIYADELIAPFYKNNKAGWVLLKIKHFFLRSIPYLLGIKPNSYAVLTAKKEGSLHIF